MRSFSVSLLSRYTLVIVTGPLYPKIGLLLLLLLLLLLQVIIILCQLVQLSENGTCNTALLCSMDGQ